VGKGEEMGLCEGLMNSANSSDQQGVLTEEDQRSVLIIGGIQIFLPNSPVETNTRVADEEVVQQESEQEAMEPIDFKDNCVCDADATTKEGKPTVTVIEGETELTVMFSPAEREEHSKELLTIFSQEDEQEMTAALECTTEEEIDNIDFAELNEE
jgi:hypothetical protein